MQKAQRPKSSAEVDIDTAAVEKVDADNFHADREPPPDTKAVDSDGRRSPRAWAEAKGLTKPETTTQKANIDWRHAAAAASHGWTEHEHHAGAPMLLTEADYDAALQSVTTADMKPHPPAVSPYSPHAK